MIFLENEYRKTLIKQNNSMKKITRLMMLSLMGTFGAADMMAQYLPVCESNYKYNIKVQNVYVKNAEAEGFFNMATSLDSQSGQFSFVKNSDGTYTISLHNGGQSKDLYYTAIDGEKTVKVDVTEMGKDWTIDLFSQKMAIRPNRDNASYWNNWGGQCGSLGLWKSGEQRDYVKFIPADDATYKKLVADVEAAIASGKHAAEGSEFNDLNTKKNAQFSNGNAEALIDSYNAYILTVGVLPEAKGVLDKAQNNGGKVGFPVQAEIDKLNAAYEAAKAAQTDKSKVDALKAQLAAFYAAEVTKPISGKAYTIKNVSKAGKTYYMHYDLSTNESSWNADASQATKYICKEVNGKYAFATEYGKYLKWFDGNNKENIDEYQSEICDFNVVALREDPSNNSIDKGVNCLLVGCFSMNAKRKVGEEKEGYFVVAADGGYSGADKVFFNGSHSSALMLEEVADYKANQVTFHAVNGEAVKGLAEGSKIATFSSTYPTVLPAGVKAYNVEAAANGAQSVTLTEVSTAIPANKGVILVAESSVTTPQTMLLATGEAVATITNTVLGSTANAAKTVAEGESIFVLADKGNTTQFYKATVGTTLAANKAYLQLNGAAPATLSLNFGGEATGIENVATADDANAPIYDLSGRRVSSTVKGGIYIQNGKKFIVK